MCFGRSDIGPRTRDISYLGINFQVERVQTELNLLVSEHNQQSTIEMKMASSGTSTSSQ
jgi:hypothetical protein